MGLSGVIVKSEQNQTELNYVLAQGAAGTTEIAPATLGRRHRVVGMFFTVSADATVKFRSGGADLTGPMKIGDSGGMVETDLASLVVGTLNNNLEIVTTGGAANGVVKVVTEAP